MGMRGSIAIGVLVAVACTIGSAGAAVEPLAFLRGSTLAGPVHLRLIVAGTPPYVFDLDRATVVPFDAARDATDVVDLVPYGRGALATIDPRQGPTSSLLLTASGSRRAASALETRAARRASLRWAVARDGERHLMLVDRASRQRRRLPWKSILGYLDGAYAQPHGPYVAIGFADPAYPGPQQAEDVFLLNRDSGSFTHVPGFPAQLDLKRSSMAWTDDGRLVFLVRDSRETRIGIYRPGARTVALRRVALPAASGGSDQFVPVAAHG
ncbi:MAG: hypothetical protein QOE10_1963 [Gaiellales bacterium]|nr:hypothetical protein [Gaiellales bacterium]